MEAYCKGGQGPPRAVAPPKKKKLVHTCPWPSDERQLFAPHTWDCIERFRLQLLDIDWFLW